MLSENPPPRREKTESPPEIQGSPPLPTQTHSSWRHTHFKGWAKPGPQPPSSPPFVQPEETLDALCGHYRIFQLRDGHRFSTDDLLTAWYGTSWAPHPARILDLGSGIGSVALIAAWRCPGAQITTIEAQTVSFHLAQRSVEFNHLTARFRLFCGDFREAELWKLLEPNTQFDLILGSPPYFPVGSGVISPHPQRAACRFELRGDVRDYCAAARDHLALGGQFACVYPQRALARILAAATDHDLCLIRRRPVVLGAGQPPLLSLFLFARSEDLPASFRTQTWIEPPLQIRLGDGTPHPEYQALKLALGLPPQ